MPATQTDDGPAGLGIEHDPDGGRRRIAGHAILGCLANNVHPPSFLADEAMHPHGAGAVRLLGGVELPPVQGGFRV